ncbi:MAG: hypothetical protein ACK58U_22600 [Rubrivivax sp.]
MIGADFLIARLHRLRSISLISRLMFLPWLSMPGVTFSISLVGWTHRAPSPVIHRSGQ